MSPTRPTAQIRSSLIRGLALLILLWMGHAPLALAWPADTDWIAVQKGGAPFADTETDFNNQFNLVGTGATSVYLYNDGNYLNFRFRIDSDPLNNKGTLTSFGWGVLVDTDHNLDSYEYMVMLDGITENIYLAQNTSPTTIGDPSDKAETIIWEEAASSDPVSGNFRTSLAGTNFNGDPDYFLDFRIPYQVFKNALGLTDNSLIKYFFGTSASAQTLSKDLSGTDLYTGSSDFTLPTGTTPTDGVINFIYGPSSATPGSTSITDFSVSEPVYIQVTDADRNSKAGVVETVDITVTASTGDSETVTLTETGPDTGVFEGSLPTTSGTDSAGVLKVTPVEVVTASYFDAATSSFSSATRTDTINAKPYTDLAVNISVDNNTPLENDTVTYTITVTNNGPVDSYSAQVQLSTLVTPAISGSPSSVPGGTDTGLTFSSYTASSGSYNSSTGYWNMGQITVGNSATMTLVMDVNSGTTDHNIDITAGLTASTYYPERLADQGNNSATSSLAVQGADLAITKTVDASTPAQNQTIHYTLTVTNNGAANATGVTVDDTLPSGINYVSDTAANDLADNVWSIGALAAGGSATLTVTATVGGSTVGSISNTATVHGDQSDPNSTNNTATADVFVGGTDVGVTLAVNNAAPAEGDSIVYTLTAENLGPNDATNIQITDALPAGLTWTSDTSGGAYNSTTGVWTIASLTNGSSTSIQITASVDAGTAGNTITNTATRTAMAEPDQDAGNDTASADITVIYADLSITKTVDNSTPNDGDTVTFTLTVQNNGMGNGQGQTATGVEVTDYMPVYITNVTQQSASAGTTYNTSTNVWSIPTLAVGQTVTLVISGTVNVSPNDPTSFYNTATITANSAVDPVSSNDTVSIPLKVSGTDLAIAIAVDNTAPGEGATVTYTLTLQNLGTINAATGVNVNALLPTGLTFVSSSTTIGSYASGSGDWTFGNNDSLATSSSVTLTIVATVNAGTTGSTLTVNAHITQSDQGDTNAANDTAAVSVIIGATDLGLAMSITAPITSPVNSANAGDSVTYTLTITNNGPNAATGVQVTDALPAAATWSADDSGGSYNSGTGVWSVGALALGASATLNITATITSGYAGTTITNTANITAASAPDQNTANDSASADVYVPVADLVVSKIVSDATPPLGNTITYTLTINNVGPDTATGVNVQDVIDPNLIAGSITIPGSAPSNPTRGTASVPSANTISWSGFDLAKNESVSLQYYVSVTLNASAENQNYNNNATVTSNVYDDVSVNDTAMVQVTPRIELPILTVVSSASPANASPGDIVTYTVNVTNTGGLAQTVNVTGDIGQFTEIALDPWGNGTPFKFIQGTSNLGNGTAQYSTDGSTYAGYSLQQTDFDATSGLYFDPAVKSWKIPMSGNMAAGSSTPTSFSVQYQVLIK